MANWLVHSVLFGFALAASAPASANEPPITKEDLLPEAWRLALPVLECEEALQRQYRAVNRDQGAVVRQLKAQDDDGTEETATLRTELERLKKVAGEIRSDRANCGRRSVSDQIGQMLLSFNKEAGASNACREGETILRYLTAFHLRLRFVEENDGTPPPPPAPRSPPMSVCES